jgi:hypothetical protein
LAWRAAHSQSFLARAGHNVTLLERAPQVGPVGAGFLLQPFGQRVLKELGLLGRDIGLPLFCAIPWLRWQMELSAAGLNKDS